MVGGKRPPLPNPILPSRRGRGLFGRMYTSLKRGVNENCSVPVHVFVFFAGFCFNFEKMAPLPYLSHRMEEGEVLFWCGFLQIGHSSGVRGRGIFDGVRNQTASSPRPSPPKEEREKSKTEQGKPFG